MLQRMIKTVAEYIAYRTKDVSALTSLMIVIVHTKYMLETDNSPALFLIAMSVFFYFPLILVLTYLALLIPKVVCMLFLEIIKIKEDYSKNGYTDSSNTGDAGGSAGEEYRWKEQKSYDWWQSQYKQYQSQQEKQQNNSSNSNYKQNNPYQRKDELSEALSFYNLTIPFTESELRDKRRKLMKTAHPDEGGSTETAADINRYFDVLKRYVS